MNMMTAGALALLGTAGCTACTRDVQALDAQKIEQQYGVAGGFPDTITTVDGPIKGTLVPITLADGRPSHLFIPQTQSSAADAVYVRDEQGLHPVRLSDRATRTAVTQSPSIVKEPTPPSRKTRSWEKEALIIGGGAGAGTAIGAMAGGKKGAAVGAAAGGVGALIYDLATRNKK